MNKAALLAQIRSKKSYLCVGLDTDLEKIPTHLLKSEDPIFEFNRQIIDATHPFCVAYKPNLAFYESQGVAGWQSLEKTVQYIRQIDKNLFTIADAKRGDIGNTSAMYAKAFFERMNFDSVTVAPYMGADSVKPFLNFDEKWVILLALTSNEGAKDFQMTHNLYKKVIKTAKTWATADQMMFVVGATRAEKIAEIRALAPEHFFLVPGVGAQGGDLAAISEHGMNDECGLLVNSSREIIYASNQTDFAEKARQKAQQLQAQMKILLEKKWKM
ncbi:MAG: orotidine-5-phosphate decarboxylase [Bacteroidota bacterium]|jgi:orotidine-5'-phosphate decarboxylase